MAEFNRRTMLIGGAAATGVAAWAARPRDHSGTRGHYFTQVQAALVAAGIATPTLVIDRQRLDANIATLKSALPPGMAYRIVAKSLPSPDLIAHVRQRASTDRLMTFNLPTLIALNRTMPDAGQLLGKPLPVAAFAQALTALPAPDKVTWLIDSNARLAQYAATGAPINLALELDVGLHRGGFVAGDDFAAALHTIRDNPALHLAGLMGYEPHVAALPTALGVRNGALHAAWDAYARAVEQVRAVLGAGVAAAMLRNAAGSPTYRLYRDTQVANEVSAGSCLVKPTHFDTDVLAPHVPAAFIATPVIKAMDGTRLPGLETVGRVQAWWDPNLARTVFIYGGNWLADPVDPPGLQTNALFGLSSNQQMMNGGAQTQLSPDQFVFFRPHQSEAVFMQFGDIAVYDGHAIVAHWPVFPASA
ncbi:alanine racemase [Novosphingobium sp.]|uniref:alanine racemase n=1 Tax=Novosphingobium sp. TaxID=1874826 RepID=UPI0033412D6D